MLDDDRGLDDRLAVIEQHRELPERPVALELREILRVVPLEQLVLELGAVGPQRDQDFLAVGREGVREELETHSLASVRRRPCSICSSLVSASAKLPLGTSPAGS